MRWPLRFCPDCGAALQDAGQDVHPRCSACGEIHYRSAKPCAGVLIEREGRLLLARRAIAPARGRWNVVGGFCEPEELPEEAARREALEETGLEIRLGPLLGMYLDRYVPGTGHRTLNVYYLAEAGEGEPAPADDVDTLRWFAPDELPADLAFAHEPRLLADWRARRAALWAAHESRALRESCARRG